MEINEGLAKIPHKRLPACVKNGIAPTMKADGTKEFWGADFDEQLDGVARKLLGENRELHTPGSDGETTEERRAALEIIDDEEVQGYNARQMMLKHKNAHPPGYKVNIYGDGSYSTLTLWWAALGGFGVWMPERTSPDQAVSDDSPGHFEQQEVQGRQVQQRETDQQQQQMSLKQDTTYHGAAIGQTGTSTRQELTAWIRVLAIPCSSCYATDSASMMNKALRLIEAAERDLEEEEMETEIKRGNPFRKPWGLQVDGDLWEQAWIAVKRRGAGNQTLRKVKGHAADQDVAKGISTAEDRDGNDKSDELADKGVEEIAGVESNLGDGVEPDGSNTENL